MGLDMLKSHRACIDLERNCLRIQGQEIPFLPEHELPEKARLQYNPEGEVIQQPGPSSSGSQLRTPQAPSSVGQQFPGSGSTLGAPPGTGTSGQPRSAPQSPQSPQVPEASIDALLALGATREQAIALLQEAGGNVDIAASLLFG